MTSIPASRIGPAQSGWAFQLALPTGNPGFVRVTRGEVLGLREQDYVAGCGAVEQSRSGSR